MSTSATTIEPVVGNDWIELSLAGAKERLNNTECSNLSQSAERVELLELIGNMQSRSIYFGILEVIDVVDRARKIHTK